MPNRHTLKAYEHAMTMAVGCGKTANMLPRVEQFALASQLRRAGYSAVLNIAEGAARGSIKQQLQYYGIARSSIHESEVILELAVKMGYLHQKQIELLQLQCDEAARTLFGYMLSLESQLAAASRLKGARAATALIVGLVTYLIATIR